MSQYPVHVGYWVDWSKGSVHGKQITVNADSSNLLIAVVAIVITVVGGVSWSTIAYTLHQIRATPNRKDGLHHIQQILLRNVSNPLVFMYEIIRTSWAWRKLSKKNLVFRTAMLVAFPLCVYTVFVVAGVMLSMLATTGDVLLDSHDCVAKNNSVASTLTPEDLAQYVTALSVWEQQEMALVLAYAQQCYPTPQAQSQTGAASVTTSAAVSNCNFYPRRFLNWTTSNPGVCPFGEGICKGPSSDIIRFDTGYLNTHSDLGINDKVENRVEFRKVTTCAPIATEKFSTGHYQGTSLGNLATYNFGKNLNLPGGWSQLAGVLGSNVTFISPESSFGTAFMPYQLQVATTVSVKLAANGSSTPSFYPRSDFIEDVTSIVSLFFLANRAIFTAPVDDPWFNATTEFLYGNQTVYYNNQPGAVLGCVDDVELCNPMLDDDNRCLKANQILHTSPYDISYTVVGSLAQQLSLNDHQLAVAQQLAEQFSASTMSQTVKYLGAYSLTAKDYLVNGETDIVSNGLPSQFWQVELQRFQAISLAGLQRSTFVTAAGPSDPLLIKYLVSSEGNVAWLCKSQKFYSSDYFSYSVVGIAMIFGTSLFIMIMSIVLTFVVPSWQLRTGKGIYRRDQWFKNHSIFLMASLYNANGQGTWTTEPINNTPVTLPDQKFAACRNSVTKEAMVAASPKDKTEETKVRDEVQPLLKLPDFPSLYSLELSPFTSLASNEHLEDREQSLDITRVSM